MKRFFLLSTIVAMMPICLLAQVDDMYFVPKKQVKQTVKATEAPTYYAGTLRDVDEYNRRGAYQGKVDYLQADSLMSDVIEFDAVSGEYPDSTVVETDMYNAKKGGVGTYSYNDYDDDMDYQYSRQLNRWYGFYDPWFYGPSYYGYNYYWPSYYYYGGYYGPAWFWHYNPYFGYYDPWYSGYYGWGYYGPWYGGYWGGYHSHYYPHYWYGGYGTGSGYAHNDAIRGVSRTSHGSAALGYRPSAGTGSNNGATEVKRPTSRPSTTVNSGTGTRRNSSTSTQTTQNTRRYDTSGNRNFNSSSSSSRSSSSFGGGSGSSFSSGGSRGGGGSFSGGGGGGSHGGGRR